MVARVLVKLSMLWLLEYMHMRPMACLSAHLHAYKPTCLPTGALYILFATYTLMFSRFVHACRYDSFISIHIDAMCTTNMLYVPCLLGYYTAFEAMFARVHIYAHTCLLDCLFARLLACLPIYL